ncbi:SusC/RagA family TonB-linked outer membrane protein [Parabacteroides chinchillae]|uniref:TonB-linked outer membrane protein, SusC/RagA family n=1 Tax=Parabacteroides chinchillae TaxID=871327 RepID=A0A8G2F3L0_9BACT|nr:TonB-dependent receptor [Parabacteroides chinchillae]SEG15209.1 TonB-linked outer membrane protein, SusC/RagA family [Parabacteroides chinchillae]
MKVHLKFSKAKTNRVKPLVLCLAIAGMAVGTYQPVFADESPIATIVNQQKTISGKVVDENGEPIIGANIVVKGTTIGIITDINGEFTLQVPSDQSILEISYIGYKSVEISVKGQKSLDIRLMSNAENLDEVIVVGYGTQKKVNLTGAVQSVSSEQLVKRNVANSSQALQGLIPGVVVGQSSGAPGAEASIQIRGTGSINSSASPLILIDGVEGDMNSIDMNAIESISVLKDAASAAIYGSKASNGVILVTTKRAQNTGVKVSYNGYVGFRTPAEMPDPVNAIEYMEAVNIARDNQDMLPQYSEELINTYKTQGADNIHNFDTNWKELLFKNTMLTHNHSVSVSGGSDRIKTFANASYNYEDGLVPNNDYNRKALRTNTDAKITDWLSAGLNLNIRRTVSKQPNAGAASIINQALTYTPVFGGINADGTWGNGQNGINPIAQAKVGGVNTSDNNDINVKGTLVLTPLKGLEILGSYDTRKYENKSDNFTNTYDTYEAGNYIMTYPTTGRARSESWSRLIRNQFNAQVSYENTFKEKHYFKGFLGFQTEEIKNKSMGAGRKNFYYDGYEQLNHGDASTSTASGGRSEFAMMSYIARFNYTFADKYLIELTGRYDGSSRFTSNNRWGFFPAASAGWRISEESFFEPLKDKISNLKIRASYGTLGNQDITGYYPYASTLSSGAGYWFNEKYTTGIYASSMSNANITWEKSTQANFGLDLTAINSKLNVTFDYYIRNITDMLQIFPAPIYVGLSSSWENAGSMKNNGWDLSINWRDKIGKVNYSITALLSDVKNEITDLYGNKYINDNNTTQERHPIYSWYGYVADGFFQSQAEIDNPDQPVYGGNKANVKPGYIKYKDISGPEGTPDGKIDDYDRTIIGDPQARYTFSLNLGAEWNNFDFSVFLQGVGKKDIYSQAYGTRPFYIGRTIFRNQLDSWSETNRDAKFPLLLIDGSGSNMNNIPSSFWVKSGAYMRVKNVTIGYTLPKKILSKTKIDNLRFYISGQNLFTICNVYDGYDPESDIGSFYPVMQVYTFGIDLRF